MKVETAKATLLYPLDWTDYELVDSGGGSKLERFGSYYLVRPEKQALWQATLPTSEWEIAHAIFRKAPQIRGEWFLKREAPKRWVVSHEQLRFWARLTNFGHVGIFPEQAVHWEWLRQQIEDAGRPLRILNLFGYTGIATIAAAVAGAEQICHVDASKAAITWAVENQKLSNAQESPIRWILDDAIKFVRREVRRNTRYDAVIMDPPAFGRGPKGEIWRFESSFVSLLEICREVLTGDPSFFLITTYAQPIPSVSLGNTLSGLMQEYDGYTEFGELALKERSSGRLLSLSIFSRWASK